MSAKITDMKRRAIAGVTAAIENGCSGHSCRINRRTGQGTNGECACEFTVRVIIRTLIRDIAMERQQS